MESVLRIACVLAALIAVQAQCPPMWEKVELGCYRVFAQMETYDRAAEICRSFRGCDGITEGHLCAPTSFEEVRKSRQIRYHVLRPVGPNFQLEEGFRLPPTTVWLGLRLGQGYNTMWESGEPYNGVALNQHWAMNRPGMNRQGMRPAFDPTNMQLNGQCATIPGMRQGPGQGQGQNPFPNLQKWGHQPCAQRAAFICEIPAPGAYNGTRPTTGPNFNQTTFGGGGRGDRPQWPNNPNPPMGPTNPNFPPSRPNQPTGPNQPFGPNRPNQPTRPNQPFNPNRPTPPRQPPNNPRQRPNNPRPRLYQQDQGYATP